MSLSDALASYDPAQSYDPSLSVPASPDPAPAAAAPGAPTAGVAPGASVLGAPMPHPDASPGIVPGYVPPPPRPDAGRLLALAGQQQGTAAGYRPTSRTFDQAIHGQETKEAAEASMDADADVVGAQLGYDAQAGASSAQMGKLVQNYDDADNLQTKVRRDQQMSALAEYHDHIDGLMRTADEAGKINPNRFFQNKSIGARVGLSIAAGLAGFGGALTHSGNPVLEMINKGISDDIEAQKAEAANASQGVGRAVNLYQLNREKLGDDDLAAKATAAAQKQSFISHLQSQVDSANAPAAFRLRAAQLMASMKKEVAGTIKELDDGTGRRVTSETFSSGAPLDILSRLKRANAIGKETQELQGETQDQRKAEAEIEKTSTEAQTEAGKAAAPALDEKRFDAAAGDLGSNSFWDHPLDATVLRHFQGTDAATKDRAAQAYNIGVAGDISKIIPGIARNPDKLREMATAYMIEPGDTAAVIAQKVALRRQNLVGAKVTPAFGTTPGITPDKP